MPSIYLYAEVLTNIRQVTLHASLQTTRNEETKIEISSDKQIITVLHDGETASLYLPTQILGNASVTIPAEKKKDLSVRLEIEDASSLSLSEPEIASQFAPWSAKDMNRSSSLRCKSCCAVLLESGKVDRWQDLPSETWYEMMDYWHCHKPHEHNSGEKNPENDGKGSTDNARPRAKQRTGLIDLVTFLLDENDCQGLKVTPSQDISPDKVQCQGCLSNLGRVDAQVGGWRLAKSRVSVRNQESSGWETHSAPTFLVATLLSLIESQAARKFVLHSGNDSEGVAGLLLWVFNPNIYYSSSARGPTPHRAMKIFYQPADEPQKMLDENQTLEEIVVPSDDLSGIKTSLEESTNILPHSARKFQEWTVGLLDRFEVVPTQGMDLNLFTDKASPMSSFPEGIEGIEGLLD